MVQLFKEVGRIVFSLVNKLKLPLSRVLETLKGYY
jgi:hypothetical protein